jgi:hypothetical protein
MRLQFSDKSYIISLEYINTIIYKPHYHLYNLLWNTQSNLQNRTPLTAQK